MILIQSTNPGPEPGKVYISDGFKSRWRQTVFVAFGYGIWHIEALTKRVTASRMVEKPIRARTRVIIADNLSNVETVP